MKKRYFILIFLIFFISLFSFSGNSLSGPCPSSPNPPPNSNGCLFNKYTCTFKTMPSCEGNSKCVWASTVQEKYRCVQGLGYSYPIYCAFPVSCDSGKYCVTPPGDVPRCESPSYSSVHCSTAGGTWLASCTGTSCQGNCCINPTYPSCGTAVCGSVTNTCGQYVSCGTCASGYTCSNGQCVPTCTPNYVNNCDATDGCGGTRTVTSGYNSCDLTSNTACGTETQCSDTLDNDCDGKIDSADSDCVTVPAACNSYTGTDAVTCHTPTNLDCYFVDSTKECKSCTGATCLDLDQNECAQNECGLTCLYDTTNNRCAECLDDTNCPAEETCDLGTGACVVPGVTGAANGEPCDASSECQSGYCDMTVIDANGKGVCAEETCVNLGGAICSSTQECKAADLTTDVKWLDRASDTTKCCPESGACTTITYDVQGNQLATVDESPCENPDENGIGTKTVKIFTNGQQTDTETAPCTIIPQRTVDAYTLFNIIITLLIITTFYIVRKRKI